VKQSALFLSGAAFVVMAAVSMAGCGRSEPAGGFGLESGAEEGGSTEVTVPEVPAPKGALLRETDLEIDENGVITRYSRRETGNIIIPASVGGKPVTGFGEGVFNSCGLTSVVIPEGVTSVGDYVFGGNKLTRLTIPAGVTTIGREAFSGNKLAGVSIPSGVRSVGDYAFISNELTSVSISEGVRYIGEGAFARNKLTGISKNPGRVFRDATEKIANSLQ
jgi:hypothetical protein